MAYPHYAEGPYGVFRTLQLLLSIYIKLFKNRNTLNGLDLKGSEISVEH